MFKNLNPTSLGLSGHQSELIEMALTYGFSGIDLNITEFATCVRLKGMDYAKRLIESSRLRVGTFSLPFDVATDEDTFSKELKKLPELAGYAAELGCLRCVTQVSPSSDVQPYHENFEFHRRRLSEIGAVLQPTGVRLAVGFQAAECLRSNKPFQFIHDLDALVLLLNMVASPSVGLLLDVWNLVVCGGSVESVQKLPADLIVAVQVADMPAEVPLADLDEKARLLPVAENSQIDIASYLAALRALGYDGPITAKPSRSALPSRRREAIVKQVSEVLDLLWQAAGVPLATKTNFGAPRN